jgi:hypothetical protein
MNTSATNKTVKVLSRHAKLSEAVKAAKIDLSYNEPLALRDLAQADRDPANGPAFVVQCANGEVGVVSVFRCDITLLNRYSPFCSCLDDSPFGFAVLKGDTIEFSRRELKKTKQNREFIAATQKTFATQGHTVWAY